MEEPVDLIAGILDQGVRNANLSASFHGSQLVVWDGARAVV